MPLVAIQRPATQFVRQKDACDDGRQLPKPRESGILFGSGRRPGRTCGRAVKWRIERMIKSWRRWAVRPAFADDFDVVVGDADLDRDLVVERSAGPGSRSRGPSSPHWRAHGGGLEPEPRGKRTALTTAPVTANHRRVNLLALVGPSARCVQAHRRLRDRQAVCLGQRASNAPAARCVMIRSGTAASPLSARQLGRVVLMTELMLIPCRPNTPAICSQYAGPIANGESK